MIQSWKEKYFHDLLLKLNNTQISRKTYWSIIKSCCNGKKIPIISPHEVDGKILTNLMQKSLQILKKKKAIFLTTIFYLKVILYQVTVNKQKIKHMIKKQYFDIEDEDIKRPMDMMEFP